MDKSCYFSKTFKFEEFISAFNAFASLFILEINSPEEELEFLKRLSRDFIFFDSLFLIL